MSTDQVRALNPGTKINLQFSIHRLHVEAAAAARKEHAAVLSAAQMSEAERLVRPMCLVILPMIYETGPAAAPRTDTR